MEYSPENKTDSNKEINVRSSTDSLDLNSF